MIAYKILLPLLHAKRMPQDMPSWYRVRVLRRVQERHLWRRGLTGIGLYMHCAKSLRGAPVDRNPVLWCLSAAMLASSPVTYPLFCVVEDMMEAYDLLRWGCDIIRSMDQEERATLTAHERLEFQSHALGQVPA